MSTKPLMMKFTQGEGDGKSDIWVNMNQVCCITSNGNEGSILTFATVANGEPAYACVNETVDEISKRPEWSQS